MKKQSRILIIGHNDLIEHSLYDYLSAEGYKQVISAGPEKWDIFNQRQVELFFRRIKPEYVFLASTRSGGIEANQKFCAEFIYSNLASQNHVIHTAWQTKVKKLLFIGSSCVYPKVTKQPISEDALLTGALEPTSEPYAVAKIAGIKMCQAYRRQYGFNAICAVPATLYGPAEDTEAATAHVLGALIGKFTKAVECGEKKVELWGSGKPKREFLYSQDFARACVLLMEKYNDEKLINIGTGREVSIKDLAKLIAQRAGFEGQIVFDRSKPDGALRKLLDSRRIRALGFKPQMSLEEGIYQSLTS